MNRRSELSEFLRSRRERLQPEHVGLERFEGARRVKGLRREELAQLARVSVDYYTKLEQGRVGNVSEPVLDAISLALRLDTAERSYLRELVSSAPARERSPEAQSGTVERVRPTLQRLLDCATTVPGYVVGRRCDVIAWNRMARNVFVDFELLPDRERNWGRLIFLHADVQALYADWTIKGMETVAYLRMARARHPHDDELSELVEELQQRSEAFREWWRRHDVLEKTHGRKWLRHPLVGELVLDHESFHIPGDPDQVLITYTAEEGSASDSALRLLSSW
ncbi:helix-turn-helix transcriptional regulator [Agromyces albus]|uniref:XRE family transcriptional regulator n=1 Tax=Agromyces albus TaxID=205332 RepID=A0A4Q2KW58_9MICO|nr:helix-turn-helix transcriptional regulator [Agromyces albus]RXZ68780.1 XRE family transcriptional regulator [Agromyces albus]